jgi:hypothetical protein
MDQAVFIIDGIGCFKRNASSLRACDRPAPDYRDQSGRAVGGENLIAARLGPLREIAGPSV